LPDARSSRARAKDRRSGADPNRVDSFKVEAARIRERDVQAIDDPVAIGVPHTICTLLDWVTQPAALTETSNAPKARPDIE
jgi:hypothetical protein